MAVVAPGLVYTAVRETQRQGRSASQFRETVAVVAAGVVSLVVAGWLFAGVRLLLPEHTPEVGRLLASPPPRSSEYLVSNLPYVCAWAFLIIAVASGVAALLALLPPVPMGTISTDSAWHQVFRLHGTNVEVFVDCELTNGALLRGTLYSHSTATEETGDRDLVLVEATLRQPRDGAIHDFGNSVVIVSAREIRHISVAYGRTIEMPQQSKG